MLRRIVQGSKSENGEHFMVTKLRRERLQTNISIETTTATMRNVS
jgi:hypothetical protein